MRVNIQHCVRCSGAKGGYLYTLTELINHMKELRERVISGDATAALQEFFTLYCFTGDDNARDIKEEIAKGLTTKQNAKQSL